MPFPTSVFCKDMLLPSMPRKMKACNSLCFKLLICNSIDLESFLSPHSPSNRMHLLSSKIEFKFSYHWISYGFPMHLSQHRSVDEKLVCPFFLLLCSPLPCLHCDSSYPYMGHLPHSQNIYFSYTCLAPLVEILLWWFAIKGWMTFKGWMQWSFGKQSLPLTYGEHIWINIWAKCVDWVHLSFISH